MLLTLTATESGYLLSYEDPRPELPAYELLPDTDLSMEYSGECVSFAPAWLFTPCTGEETFRWYQLIDKEAVEIEGSSYYYSTYKTWIYQGPSEIGEYRLDILVGEDVVLTVPFSIRGHAFGHTYQLTAPLDKEYDGEPVVFSPYDSKQFLVDDGKTSWAELEEDGLAAYIWRVYADYGKFWAWTDMDGIHAAAGTYQLVIQEAEEKEWMDAAVFEFEITEGKTPEYTVTFDARGGTPEPETQTLQSGETVSEPQSPVRIGAVFTGWYTAAAGEAGDLFSFEIPVTADLTLYAGWLIPEPDGVLKLPALLTSLEDEAFAGIAAEAVIIPASVTDIAGNPFAGSAVEYVYGFVGSAVETFAAAAEGLTFVPMDEDWLASH